MNYIVIMRVDVMRGASILTTEAEGHERLNYQNLRDQIAQVEFTRKISRTSPASIVQYAVESLASTGFPNHVRFLEQTRRYAAEFRQFTVEADLADADSPHAFGVQIGMSNRPVNFEAIPKFEDQSSLASSINAAIMEILLLALFFVVLFVGAFLSFLRVDI